MERAVCADDIQEAEQIKVATDSAPDSSSTKTEISSLVRIKLEDTPAIAARTTSRHSTNLTSLPDRARLHA
jgi:hypothetical protein